MISFSTGKLRRNTCFEPIRSLFSFLTAQTEKNSWKNWGKQDWLFDSLMSRTRYLYFFSTEHFQEDSFFLDSSKNI